MKKGINEPSIYKLPKDRIAKYLSTFQIGKKITKDEIIISCKLTEHEGFPKVRNINKALKRINPNVQLYVLKDGIYKLDGITEVPSKKVKSVVNNENSYRPRPVRPVWEGEKIGNKAAGTYLARNVFATDYTGITRTVLEITLKHNDFIYESFDDVIEIAKDILDSEFGIELELKDNFYTPTKKYPTPQENIIEKPLLKISGKEHDFSRFVLHVYDSLLNIRCMNGSNHDETTVTIQTHNMYGKTVSFNAFYCMRCNKFYTNIQAVKNDFALLDYPIIKMEFHCLNSNNWNPNSILNLYGYNVKNGGLSEYERHNLLAKLMNFSIVSKQKIISMLNFYIGLHDGQSHMHEAIKKWQSDLEYTQNYKIYEQPKIVVNKVSINYK